MSEEYGSDFITIVDDDGQEFELEVLDTMDYIRHPPPPRPLALRLRPPLPHPRNPPRPAVILR